MLSSTKYPIEVCCVVASDDDVTPEIETVIEHTVNLGLKYTLREYNSWKHSDDRDIIERLPAFHVYFGERYMDTLYPDENLLDNINTCVKKYEEKRIEALKYTQTWSKFILAFWKRKMA